MSYEGSGIDRYLGLDLDRYAEWQFGHADGGARMRPAGGSVQLNDQIAEAVDDERHFRESRRAVDHAEHPEPCRDAIEISELALQARKNRQRRETRGVARFLQRHVEPDLPQRCRE